MLPARSSAEAVAPVSPGMRDAATAPPAGAPAGFDLLRDFWVSIQGLAVRGVDPANLDRRLINDAVRAPMIRAFETAEYKVSSWELDWLRKRTAEAIGHDEFCVTLDRREYFAEAQFQLDLTRSISDMKRTGSQYFQRRPRQRENSLAKQLRALKGALIQNRSSQVVLADDGLSTGQMLTIVIDECAGNNLKVNRVVVCCNNTHIQNIGEVAVASVVKSHFGRPWLNERDLYWGLPRSGLSFAPGDDPDRFYGIPFSFDARLVQQRIGIEDRVTEFRAACLEANIVLWRQFEKMAGARLCCEDCPSLGFVPDVLGKPGFRVVDLLTFLAEGNELPLERY